MSGNSDSSSRQNEEEDISPPSNFLVEIYRFLLPTGFRRRFNNVRNKSYQEAGQVLKGAREKVLLAGIRILAKGLGQDQQSSLNIQERVPASVPILPCTRGGDEMLIPGIFFCTMPKSGTVYISHYLAKGLRIELMYDEVAPGFFPDHYVIPRALSHLGGGNKIRYNHCDSKPINVRYIAESLGRIIVHVRDPRQATLSWIHYYNNYIAEERSRLRFLSSISPPDSYPDWSWDQQLDWQFNMFLPIAVQWLKDWVELADSDDSPLDILFTTHESFVTEKDKYFNEILDFYDIPRSEFKPIDVEKTTQMHFRKGKTNEWRDIFTPEQKEKALHTIGPELLKRFDWPES